MIKHGLLTLPGQAYDAVLARTRASDDGGYPVEAYSAPTLDVSVSRGVWIVECPESGCGQAIVYSDGKPFICLRHDQWWMPVLPDDWQVIEALLKRRPPQNQNRLIGETVATLQRENREHGLDSS